MCFQQTVASVEEGQSGMTVEVYKAQIADLSMRAASLEKVLKHYRCFKACDMYYSCMIIIAPLHMTRMVHNLLNCL